MTLQKAVCMLTISSINVKGFIHGVHRYANAQSFSGLGTKLVALMVISVLIFALYLQFLKLFFFFNNSASDNFHLSWQIYRSVRFYPEARGRFA